MPKWTILGQWFPPALLTDNFDTAQFFQEILSEFPPVIPFLMWVVLFQLNLIR